MKSIKATYNLAITKEISIPENLTDNEINKIVESTFAEITTEDIVSAKYYGSTWKAKNNFKPRIGIIYNWKGLKEENYVYSLPELMKVDPSLWYACLSEPEKWHDSILSPAANKTWQGKLLQSSEEVSDFLSGKYNSESDSEDWYWENVADNNLYKSIA